MSAAPPNAFIGWTRQPTDADLVNALGAAKPAWDRLIKELEAQLEVSIREWRSYSAKAGWSLRLLRGKRTIVWLTPRAGCFHVAFVLGDKALLAAAQARLPARVTRALRQAERYPEGNGVRLLVKSAGDIPALIKLAEIKLRN